jgi:hypothetical protein
VSCDPNEPTYVHCPYCPLQLKPRGSLAAPGKGIAYVCDDGHYFVRLGTELIDTAEWVNDHPHETPPWIMSADDVR